MKPVLATDWLWFKKAPQEQLLSDRMQVFFASKGFDIYGCQFTIDGAQQLDSRHASGWVATNAVASLAATAPLSEKFVNALWEEPVPQQLVERYYDGLLYLMSL